MKPLDPLGNDSLAAESLWLDRARSWVLNVLVLDGLSILGSAVALRRWGSLEFGVDTALSRKVLMGSLVAVFLASMFVLRGVGGRDRLQEASTRGPRYFRSRLGAVAIGWLALPLGMAYGLLNDPSLGGVAPFWLAALVLGRMSFPRREDLEGFDEPMSEGTEAAP